MNSSEHLIALGKLSFCLQQRQFFQGKSEVRAEPKVCELLAYLYEHRNRYVSLQELHDELWRGRIVSDTAVRRTISKLRTLLGEDGEQQGFIRSLSKRGYKLVLESEPLLHAVAPLPESTVSAESQLVLPEPAAVSAEAAEPVVTPPLADQTASPTTTDVVAAVASKPEPASQAQPEQLPISESTEAAEITPHTAQATAMVSAVVQPDAAPAVESASTLPVAETEMLAKSRRAPRWLFWSVWLLAAIALIWGVIYVSQQLVPIASDRDKLLSEQALELDVESVRSMTISSDGYLLVYAAKLAGQNIEQLYMRDLRSGVVRQLTQQTAPLVYLSVAFLAKNESLLLISTNGEQYTLSQLALSAQAVEPVALLQRQEPLLNLTVSPEHHLILLSAYSNPDSAAIYQFDLTNRKLTPRSFPAASNMIDRLPQPDPTGHAMAFIRNAPNDQTRLVIQDLNSHVVRQQFLLPAGRVINLQWRDQHRLLLLYFNKLVELDIRTGQQRQLKQFSDKKNSFGLLLPWQDDRVLLVEKRSQTQFYQRHQGSGQPVLNLPADAVSLYYGGSPTEYFVVRPVAGKSGETLSRFNPQSGATQLLLELNEAIYDLVLSPDGRYLHLMIGNRLALYDLKQGQLVYLTSGQQVNVLGEFSHDQQTLIYGENFGGTWRLMQYRLSSGERQLWRSGFVQVRRLPTGYLLQDEQRRITVVDSHQPVTAALADLKISNQFRIQVRYPWLYTWVFRDSRVAILRYHLQTGQSSLLPLDNVAQFELGRQEQDMLYNHTLVTQKVTLLNLTD